MFFGQTQPLPISKPPQRTGYSVAAQPGRSFLPVAHEAVDAYRLGVRRCGQYRTHMSWDHAETVEIAATPAEVYNIVSNLERMGEWSPENKGGSWIVGDGTNVGDRFEGNNAIGDRTWSAVAEVVRCDPGNAFCFTVGALDNPVAEWGYHLEATGQGTQVTETWKMTQLPPSLVDATEERVQGRADMVADGMATTLAKLKASIEG